ncbi:MAG: hypothetical protein ACI8XM_000082 [Haloarculaceae archaeon]|jgi:hypothetical protein
MHTETRQPLIVPDPCCPALDPPETPVSPPADAESHAGAGAPPRIELESTRLDALDHADALATTAASVAVPVCRRRAAARLAAVFEAAASLLAREDHSQRVVRLAIPRSDLRVLEAAHRRTTGTHDSADIARIYREHADAIQAHRRETTPREVNTHAIGDA